jgi:tetratricopeptide (TPR) repeat protein
MANFYPNRSTDILRKILVVFVYALLLTPMLLSSRYFFPYISTKTFYFRLLVEIAFVLYLLLAFSDSRHRPNLSPLHWAIFLYTTIVMAAGIFGVNFYRSFWGNTERGEGILTFLHVIMLFVILAGLFRSQKSWERYFLAVVIVGLVSAIYATFQKLCGDPGSAPATTAFAKFCENNIVSGDVSRISALIGNAAFYAGYLITNIYLALWLSFRRHQAVWMRLFLWAVIIYELVIINYTRTRGAIIGLVLGLAVMMVLALFTSRRAVVRYSAAGAIVFLVLAGSLVYYFRDTPFILNAGGLNNVTHISSTDTTTESRLLTWQASLRGWQDRFWLGYGYENFAIPFNKYFPAKVFRDAGSQIWFDRAHSIFFDVSVSNGIFGILTYLSFYVLAFWILWQYYRKDRENHRFTFIIFVGFLFSYLLQNLFVFDTLGTYIAFYSILAFITYLSVYTPQVNKPKTEKFVVSPVNPFLATVLIVVLAFTTYSAVFKPAQANAKVTEALYLSSKGDLQGMLDKYREVLDMNTYVSEEARQKLAEAVMQIRDVSSISNEAKYRAFRMAINEMDTAIKRAPQDARNYMFLMALYNNDPEPGPGLRNKVIEEGRKALELSPTRPQIYFEMGQAAFSLNQYDEGVGYFETAVKLNPATAESHWNLALAYAVAGKYADAEKQIDYIFDHKRMGKIGDAGLKNLINIYSNGGQAQLTVRLYQEYLDRNPNDSKSLVNLALIYGNTCQVEKAAGLLEIAGRLDPQVASGTPVYLQQLQTKCTIK